ncbi:MAG: hypothetical protein WC523_04670 [Patescibacteria group bacterium]
MSKVSIIQAKNLTGSTIPANRAVYISGFDISDGMPLISLADCNDALKMPSVGVTIEDIVSENSIINIRMIGTVGGLDTAGRNINDEVFVGPNGTLVYENPSLLSSSAIIQTLGVITYANEYPNGQIILYPMEVERKIRHDEILDILPDQHHNENHVERHMSGGEDELLHSQLPDLQEDDHQIYTLADGTRAMTSLVVGTPTGGNKGAGTINCSGDIYKNNSAFLNPDYVFEQAFTGKIEKNKDKPGAKEYKGLKTLKDLETYLRNTNRLPAIKDGSAGTFSRMDMLLEALEESYLYILDISKDVEKLEEQVRESKVEINRLETKIDCYTKGF